MPLAGITIIPAIRNFFVITRSNENILELFDDHMVIHYNFGKSVEIEYTDIERVGRYKNLFRYLYRDYRWLNPRIELGIALKSITQKKIKSFAMIKLSDLESDEGYDYSIILNKTQVPFKEIENAINKRVC
jgi:hypothetical protein